MKSTRIVVLFLSIISFISISADQQAWHAPLADKSLLLDIVKTKNNRLVVVGEHGHILTSSDGIQWQQANVPTTTTLTAVFFLDDQLGWAVGHDGTILHSQDGGENWLLQLALTQLEKPFLDIVFKDKNHGIAVGAYGLLYRTRDGGKNWQAEFHHAFLHPDDVDYLNQLKLEDEEAYLDERSGILPHFNRLLQDGRTLYLVGEIGLIAKSNDFGESWQKFNDIYHGSFFDITRTPLGNLLVCGLRGNVFRSETNGSDWTIIPSEHQTLLNSIVLHEQQIFILGNNGVVLLSNNDGNSFIALNQADGKSLMNGVWFNDKLIAVSEAGIKTINVTYP